MADTSCFDGQLRELSLFAGAGGGVLASKLLGWRTVCAVEINRYASCILAQRQNDGILPPFPIWDDICTFDGKPWKGIIDVISGGFPCQDISVAGNGAGINGKRSGLWAEMARIIGEVRPEYAFIENSPMLTFRGLDRVLADLAAMGFNVEWGCISARECAAPHLRNRIWIVGYANHNGQFATEEPGGITQRSDESAPWAKQTGEFARSGKQHEKLANSNSNSNSNNAQRLVQKSQSSGIRGQTGLRDRTRGEPIWTKWPIEPGMGRVADGVAARVDRLKALGNGQVPRVAATAFTILKP